MFVAFYIFEIITTSVNVGKKLQDTEVWIGKSLIISFDNDPIFFRHTKTNIRMKCLTTILFELVFLLM